MEDATEIALTKLWLEEFVIGLNLCPFAKQALPAIEYILSDARSEQVLASDLEQALMRLKREGAIETMLLIHPSFLLDFSEYNDFLDVVDAMLVAMGLEGEIQVASFHPHYQFADTDNLSADNFTNRSPFPMLHLLREQSVEKAIMNYPKVDDIPNRNIRRMRRLGYESLAAKLTKFQTLPVSDESPDSRKFN